MTTKGNDIILLQKTSSEYVGAGEGNDRYILNSAVLDKNQKITITDPHGTNSLHLVGGLTITGSKVTNNALLLTLSNGATVTLLGANTFQFLTGGDPLTGQNAQPFTFTDFVTQGLGYAAVPATGKAESTTTVTVNNTGGTSVGGGGGTSGGVGGGSQTFTLTVDTPSVTEGNSGAKNLTFTLTLDQAPTEAVTVNYQTLTTGTATANDDFAPTTGTVTFAPGQTAATVSVQVFGDTTYEPDETVQVKFSGSKLTGDVIATGTITNDDNIPITAASSKSRVISGIDDSSLLSRNDRIVQALDASRIESDWRWQKSTVTYSFNTTIPSDYAEEKVDTTGWNPFPTDLMPVVDRIMSYTDSLLAIHLNKVAQNGDIRYNLMFLGDRPTKNGHAYYPSSYWKKGGDIFLNVGISPNSTTSNRAEEGFYGYKTILHELGHALGLKHPFAEAGDPPGDVNLGTNEDLRVFSVMSYTDFREIAPQFTAEKGADGRSTVRVEYQQIFPRSFMVYDIAALQALYGADTTTMSGNNTYFFDPPGTVRTALYTEGAVHYPLPVYITIWDSGGEDTIDLSATKHTNIVRLKPGSYSDIDFRDIDTQIREQQQRYAEELGTNYYDSWVRDAFTQVSDRLYTGEKALGIAYGTVIENVIGGSGDDIFYDNQVDNKLFGGEGNDTFYLGEGGYDTIDGGQGQDTVILPVSRDTVTMQQSGTETIVVAEHFAARLIGVESLKFSDGTLSLV